MFQSILRILFFNKRNLHSFEYEYEFIINYKFFPKVQNTLKEF